MKKLILAAAVVFSTIAFSACTKENNVQPQHKANTLQDGGVGIPPAGDKGNLGQGDGHPWDLSQ